MPLFHLSFKTFFLGLIATLVLTGQILLAQVPLSRIHTLPDPFRREPIDDIIQARDGHLWIGTRKGLMSFDGLEFKRYPASDSSSNTVTAIFEDEHQQIWVGYNNGHIDLLEKGAKKLRGFTPEEGLPTVPITGFVSVRNNLWISTYGEGAYIWTGKRLFQFGEDDGLLSADIYTIATDNLGRVWAGSDAGLVEMRFHADFKKEAVTIAKKTFPDQIVRAILPDADGQLWLGFFDGGIALYNPSTGTSMIPFSNWSHGPIQSLALFPGRELWIGTDQHGLLRYDIGLKSINRIDCSTKKRQKKINDLLADTEGNIWFSTPSEGLVSITAKIRKVSGDPYNVQAILENKDGQVWAGTPQGLFQLKYEPECGWTWPSTPTHLMGHNILCVGESPDGAIWAGTFGDGVFRLDRKDGSILHLTENDGLTNGNILSLHISKEKIWLTTLGGVSQLAWHFIKGKKNTIYNLSNKEGVSSQFIYCSYQTKNDHFWFGTDGNGLVRLDPQGAIETYTQVADKPLHSVYAIIEDDRGHLWICSPDRGILEFDGKTFSTLLLKSGLASTGIMGLSKDIYGNIIIPYPAGIAILNPATRHLIYYDKGVGLDEFMPNLNALSSNKSGTIWMGGDNGLYSYNTLLQSPQIHPKTVILDFSLLDGRSIGVGERLPANENYLRFHFSGLWYTNPDKVRYRYKLVGYDRDWKETRDRQVIYSNLPKGSYELHIQSSENEIFTDEPVVVVPFSIAAPWYLQWWFLSLILLSVVGTIYLVIQSRERRISKEAKIRRERVEMQLEILKSQINPHFLFNSFNSLLAVIEKDPKEAIHYVEELSAFFRFILAYREKELIPLFEEILVIQHYGKLLKRRFGNALNLMIELDDTEGFVVPLTLQLLVENAVKHNVASRSKPLTVRIYRNEAALIIENNRQIKNISEPSTGIGLQNLDSQYKLLCGRSVSVNQSGDSFRVTVPLILNG